MAAGCPEQPLRGPSQWATEPADRLIDDFEDGDVFIAIVAGRTGGAWIRGSDDTGVVTAEPSARCAARGTKAGHFAASGFTDWGANWTAIFRDAASGTAQGYDARSYSAISFWGAVGGGSPSPFLTPLGVTTVDVAWNGGICNVCMDYYGAVVPFTSVWQRFVVRFDDLKQNGSGDPFAMRRDQLVGFILWPRQDFDLWIDDLRFEP